MIFGALDEDWFAYAVSIVDDLNQNGFPDLLVGAPKDGLGMAFVFFGPIGESGSVELNAATAGGITGVQPDTSPSKGSDSRHNDTI